MDPDGVALPEPDRGILDYALKLTRTPAAIGQEDVQRLRDVGLDDRAIHDVCQVTAYYNFVNRMADGLGVELEAYWGDEVPLVVSREAFGDTH
jgi:uncharacterized peroxidase-related enzyme